MAKMPLKNIMHLGSTVIFVVFYGMIKRDVFILMGIWKQIIFDMFARCSEEKNQNFKICIPLLTLVTPPQKTLPYH
jgi:hypothetical protein